MDNNVGAILGITTTENSQVPFIVNLINTLTSVPLKLGRFKN